MRCRAYPALYSAMPSCVRAASAGLAEPSALTPAPSTTMQSACAGRAVAPAWITANSTTANAATTTNTPAHAMRST